MADQAGRDGVEHLPQGEAAARGYGDDRLLAWPSVKLLAPGSGAFLSASAFGAGVGAVVDVWAMAPNDVAEAIKVAMSSFFMMVSW